MPRHSRKPVDASNASTAGTFLTSLPTDGFTARDSSRSAPQSLSSNAVSTQRELITAPTGGGDTGVGVDAVPPSTQLINTTLANFRELHHTYVANAREAKIAIASSKRQLQDELGAVEATRALVMHASGLARSGHQRRDGAKKFAGSPAQQIAEDLTKSFNKVETAMRVRKQVLGLSADVEGAKVEIPVTDKRVAVRGTGVVARRA